VGIKCGDYAFVAQRSRQRQLADVVRWFSLLGKQLQRYGELYSLIGLNCTKLEVPPRQPQRPQFSSPKNDYVIFNPAVETLRALGLFTSPSSRSIPIAVHNNLDSSKIHVKSTTLWHNIEASASPEFNKLRKINHNTAYKMAPVRPKKRDSNSAAMKAVATPRHQSPIKQRKGIISAQQKQALIDNLQLESTRLWSNDLLWCIY
jgi:hypothetical protein